MFERSKIKEDVIFRAEELADKTKIPVEEIYGKIAEKIPEYGEIIEGLAQGKLKSEVYEEYLSEDVLEIVRAGERKGLVVSSILSEVWKTKQQLGEIRSKFKKSLIFPVAYFSVISSASFFIMMTLEGRFRSIGIVKDWSAYEVLKMSYIPVNLGILLLMLFILLRPDLFPLTKKIYRYVEGSSILNLTRFFYKAGLPMKQIVEYFQGFGGLTGKVFRETEESIEGYMDAMENFLDPEEIAIMNAGFRTGRFQEVIESIAESKIERAMEEVEKAGKVVFYIAVLLGGIPILYVLGGYGLIFMQIIGQVMGGMGRV